MPNRLANENSPYLIQHADNPVDWYPWGEAALSRARSEEKPIFLSIGYAACHWCHVMAHESFEDESIATILNEHFINIKVDREERPDLDSIYMAATLAMTGSGGWPMSVFLTPSLRPFYTGTYFPPVARYNMPSFRDLLTSIVRAWREERGEIERVGEKVAGQLQRQSTSQNDTLTFSQELLDGAAKHLHDSYDWGFGGWGQAPKFPQPMTIEFLLMHSQSKNTGEPTGTKAAFHALQAMARGGMYDVVGGGFSRYSTDNFWFIPHFEKMLYDNAQLIRAYLHAYQLTGESFYRRIAEESLAFVSRELTGPEGGFYSSLDADSEGVEGKYYLWEAAEIQFALGDDWEFFKATYGITITGNWEGKTVLQRALDGPTLAAKFKLPEAGVAVKLADCHSRLLILRTTRQRPGTDDKVITAWNGLMLSTFAEAAQVLESGSSTSGAETELLYSKYLKVATRSANFLLTALRPNGKLRRVWRNGKASGEVFLEDYAALILGLLDLYQTDFNARWFAAAQELADELIELFSDPAGGFFDTPSSGESLLMRPKDLQDNATPSGSALAAEALLKLAAFTDRTDYRDLAEQSLCLVAEPALRYPTAFARWLSAADFSLAQVRQVAILGEMNAPETQAMLRVVREKYRPYMVVALSPFPPAKDSPALLADRRLINNKPSAYVCEGFVCKTPVTGAEELKLLL
jgi:uncharacterized protein YyaL (SSP411 family)